MSLNKAIIQYADALKDVSHQYSWIVGANIHIPITFLLDRQGDQVVKAYPGTISHLKRLFGDEVIDRLLAIDGYESQLQRDVRLELEDVFKRVSAELVDYLTKTKGQLEPNIRASVAASMIMAYKDVASCLITLGINRAEVYRIESDSRQQYLTSSKWFG